MVSARSLRSTFIAVMPMIGDVADPVDGVAAGVSIATGVGLGASSKRNLRGSACGVAAGVVPVDEPTDLPIDPRRLVGDGRISAFLAAVRGGVLSARRLLELF